MFELGLNMIVKDARFFLEHTLASAIPFVDEVVVVDTGSSDGSEDIARRLGAKVIEVQTSDLAKARNIALEHSESPWLLALDSDEIMMPRDFHNLRQRIQDGVVSDVQEIGCYNYFGMGRWATIYVARVLRRGSGITWSGAIHESLAPLAFRNNVEIRRFSDVALRHLEICGPDRSADKRERNRTRLMKRLEVEVDSIVLRALLALEWFAIGDSRQAIYLCEEALRIDPNAEQPRRFLGQFHAQSGDLAVAKEYFDWLLSENPRNVRALVGRASIAYRNELFEEGLKDIEVAAEEDRGTHQTLNKAALLARLGSTNEAQEALEDAARDPMLNDERIYLPEQRYSLYTWQSSLLPAYERMTSPEGFWRILDRP